MTPEEQLRLVLGADCEDPVAEACKIIMAWQNQQERHVGWDISTVGGRIRCARMVAGLSQEQLAFRWGKGKWQVVKLEQGDKDMPVEWVHGLSRIVGVSIDWLLMRSDDGGPTPQRGVMRKYKPLAYEKNKERQRQYMANKEEAARLNALWRKAQEAATERAEVIPVRKKKPRRRALDK